MIRVESVSKRFGAVTALDDVSLAVAPGEVLSLLGANGAGKTTLLNVLLGFVVPDAGTASVDGVMVGDDVPGVRRRIGYVPEQVLLYDSLTGIEHLQFFAELAGHSLTLAAAAAALASAGLDRDAADRRLATYSKGMRQKVALAIALSKQARVLLLDEPLSGLDPSSAIDLVDRLRELADSGLAILLTTHDLLRARDVATRIGVMRAGRLSHLADASSVDVAQLESWYLGAVR